MGTHVAMPAGGIALKSGVSLCPAATWPCRSRRACLDHQRPVPGAGPELGATCRPSRRRRVLPVCHGLFAAGDALHRLPALLSARTPSEGAIRRQIPLGGSSRDGDNYGGRRSGRRFREVRAQVDRQAAGEDAETPTDNGFLPRQRLSEDDSEDAMESSGVGLQTVPRREEDGGGSSMKVLPNSFMMDSFLYPDKNELPDDVEMSIWDHLEELRQRIFFSAGAVGLAIAICFSFVKDLVKLLEAPVYTQGVRFLQLSPGEYFFTTLKVAGYSGLLVGGPVILYEIIAFVLPGLTRSERKFLAPIVLGSSVLFYVGIIFSYLVLTPAALNFFVNYSEGAVESIWSIDQYFEFVLVLMFSTGLAFQVPVIQLLLGQTGLVSGEQMLAVWKYVVVGAVTVAAVLTPSTDPLTQLLLAGPLMGLYLGGAAVVKALDKQKGTTT